MSANNRVHLFGRLVKDVDIQPTNTGKIRGRFSVAVTQTFKGSDGKYGADFIGCIVFGKRAEALAKYAKKGSRIVVEGEWRTGNYEKDGVKVYTNELVVDDFAFADSNKIVSEGEAVGSETSNMAAGLNIEQPVPLANDFGGSLEELPFQ